MPGSITDLTEPQSELFVSDSSFYDGGTGGGAPRVVGVVAGLI